MQVPSRFAAWVLDTPRWKFLTLLFAVMFFRTGVTFNVSTLLPIVRDPYHNPLTNPYQHYLLWSWLGPFLAHQVGATTAASFSLFYLVFSLLFTALMVCWIFAGLPEHLARVAMLVFALLPVSGIAYYWVFTDSLTLFLLAAALYFPRNLLMVALLGVGVGMQHFEQGFFAAGAALFALAWTERRGKNMAYRAQWALTLLLGVMAGKVALMLVFQYLDIQVNSGRWYWLRGSWPTLLRRFGHSYHVAVFSTFGVGWLVLVMFLRRRSPEVVPVGVAIAGLLLLLPISDDPTRVLANVSFPLVCVFVLRNRELVESISREKVGLLAFLWCLVPWVFVWAGKPLGSAAFHDLASLYHRELPSVHAPVKPWMPVW